MNNRDSKYTALFQFDNNDKTFYEDTNNTKSPGVRIQNDAKVWDTGNWYISKDLKNPTGNSDFDYNLLTKMTDPLYFSNIPFGSEYTHHGAMNKYNKQSNINYQGNNKNGSTYNDYGFNTNNSNVADSNKQLSLNIKSDAQLNPINDYLYKTDNNLLDFDEYKYKCIIGDSDIDNPAHNCKLPVFGISTDPSKTIYKDYTVNASGVAQGGAKDFLDDYCKKSCRRYDFKKQCDKTGMDLNTCIPKEVKKCYAGCIKKLAQEIKKLGYTVTQSQLDNLKNNIQDAKDKKYQNCADSNTESLIGKRNQFEDTLSKRSKHYLDEPTTNQYRGYLDNTYGVFTNGSDNFSNNKKSSPALLSEQHRSCSKYRSARDKSENKYFKLKNPRIKWNNKVMDDSVSDKYSKSHSNSDSLYDGIIGNDSQGYGSEDFASLSYFEENFHQLHNNFDRSKNNYSDKLTESFSNPFINNSSFVDDKNFITNTYYATSNFSQDDLIYSTLNSFLSSLNLPDNIYKYLLVKYYDCFKYYCDPQGNCRDSICNCTSANDGTSLLSFKNAGPAKYSGVGFPCLCPGLDGKKIIYTGNQLPTKCPDINIQNCYNMIEAGCDINIDGSTIENECTQNIYSDPTEDPNYKPDKPITPPDNNGTPITPPDNTNGDTPVTSPETGGTVESDDTASNKFLIIIILLIVIVFIAIGIPAFIGLGIFGIYEATKKE